MTVQVKVCGLTRREDALAVARAGADFAGLVFHSRSPRNVGPAQAGALAGLLRGRVRIVALLADPSDGELALVLAAADPDLIQLHGNESPARVAEIRAKSGKPVMKVLRIADEADFAPLAGFEAAADMLLFDARPPAQRGVSRRPWPRLRLEIAP